MIRLEPGHLAAIRADATVPLDESKPLATGERPKRRALPGAIALIFGPTHLRVRSQQAAFVALISGPRRSYAARFYSRFRSRLKSGFRSRQRRIASRAFSALRLIHARAYSRCRSGSR